MFNQLDNVRATTRQQDKKKWKELIMNSKQQQIKSKLSLIFCERVYTFALTIVNPI